MKGRFDDERISVVAISADGSEESAAYVAEEGIRIPLLSDPKLAVISAYGVAMDGGDIAVPAVFIIRPDRTIAWRYVGETMADRPNSAGLLERARRAQ